MPNFKAIGISAVKFVKHNAPTILTVTAVFGVVATAFTSSKASVNAYKVVKDEEQKKKRVLTKKEIVKATWKFYIPTAVVGTVTVGSIIGSHSIHLKRTAAIASMYTIADTALKEYKQKVVETIGERKEQKIADQITQEHIDASPISKGTVIHTGKGDTLMYESVTGRYFYSDLETVRKIANDLVHGAQMGWGYISLNAFCQEIGLPRVLIGDELGWDNMDAVLDIDTSTMLAENGKPCVVLGYKNLPWHGFRE